MAGESSKRDRAIAALLTKPSLEEAARFAGCSIRTLHRWRQQPEFRAAFKKARRHTFDDALAKLSSLSDTAVEELRKILTNPNILTRDRLTAIRTVLEHARATEEADVTALIERLEALVSREGESL